MTNIFMKANWTNILSLLPVIAISILLTGCTAQSKTNTIAIGIQASPAMALVMVAKDKGFFAQEGLDIDVVNFTAGKFALQSLLSGGVDFAVAGEVPVCLASMQGNNVRVLSEVVASTTNQIRVVARKDDGLKDPQAYFKAHKRKLATSFGGGPEFFTYRFLQQNHIDKDEVELLSQRPEDMPASLATGSVDAISIFDPFAAIAEIKLGNKAITFADPSIYSEFYVLCCRPQEIEKYPQSISGITRALVHASEYIDKNPAAAKEIVQHYTKLDSHIIDVMWKNFVFKPALDKRLVDYWQAESQWAKDTGKIRVDVKNKDFRSIIDERFLKLVSPSAVKI